MKKIKFIFNILIIIQSILFVSSCIKDKGANENMGDFKDHPMLWRMVYPLEFSGGEFILPENEDNLLFLILKKGGYDAYCDYDTSETMILAIDKNGKELWRNLKKYANNNTTRYFNDNIYCLLDFNSDSALLQVLDATNGNTIHEFFYEPYIRKLKNNFGTVRIFLLKTGNLLYKTPFLCPCFGAC